MAATLNKNTQACYKHKAFFLIKIQVFYYQNNNEI